MEKFKSGFVSIIGQPNVGKSTLMNCFMGEKIAIVSNKPQTTRNKIQAILTRGEFQIVFIDTPGIHSPKTKLGENMVKKAEGSIKDVDAILYLVNPVAKISPADLKIIEKLKNAKSDVVLVINKIDTISKTTLLEVIDSYKSRMDFSDIVPVSAIQGENTRELLELIVSKLGEGPKYFPDDMTTDQPERQICSELIREKILTFMQDEIPHGVAVDIMSMKTREDKELIDIEATVFCEKESHKGMIIGKKGAVLKELGTKARADIERIFASPVNLQLWVKVKKDWRDSDFFIKNFGYNPD